MQPTVDEESPSGNDAAATPDACTRRPPRGRTRNIGTEYVDRGFPAASGLSTALWGARSASGCCADAPSFGWEIRSAGAPIGTVFLRRLLSSFMPIGSLRL